MEEDGWPHRGSKRKLYDEDDALGMLTDPHNDLSDLIRKQLRRLLLNKTERETGHRFNTSLLERRLCPSDYMSGRNTTNSSTSLPPQKS